MEPFESLGCPVCLKVIWIQTLPRIAYLNLVDVIHEICFIHDEEYQFGDGSVLCYFPDLLGSHDDVILATKDGGPGQ